MVTSASPPIGTVSAADTVAWVQVGGDIDGEAAGDESGRSVPRRVFVSGCS